MAEARRIRVVENENLKALMKVRYLQADIESLELRERWERERMNRMTQQITACVGGSGGKGGMDEAFAAMADIEQRHRLLVKSYTRQIVGEIRDPEKRSLARLIYLDGVADIRARERLGLSRGEFERLRRELEAGL